MTSPTPLRVCERTIYRGPNLFARTPMIRIQVDLGELEHRPTTTLPGFTDALLAALPGLSEHGCSYGRPGGFVLRLRAGTWTGHVVEHVALELQREAGVAVTRGKTRSVRDRPGVYNILYTFEDEPTALAAGRAALALVASLLPSELAGVEGLDRIVPPPPAPGLEAARAYLAALASRARLGPSTASLVAEAHRRRIPVERLNEASLIQLGHGRAQQRIRASITGKTSLIGVEIAGNKDLARRLLAKGGVAVPKGGIARDADEAIALAHKLRWPVVVKPLDANHGRGVHIGLATADAVRTAFADAATHGRRVIIEEMLRGRDHRILVVGGAVVAVAERVPAHVVGDGVSTLAELVATVNADPRRGSGHGNVLTAIKVDATVLALLAERGLSLTSVPDAGQTVDLRATANLSTGGTAIDRTDQIHPENAALARRAAAILDLDIAGIDFITPDIAKPARLTGGGIIEVNAAPGLRMHLAPSEGQARDVARPIIEMLFPGRATGRVPVIAITGTNGKSTTARRVKHIFRQAGATVGLTSTTGAMIDEEQVTTGDATGPKSAKLILGDPTVDVAVLETARGGMLREGLGFDRADVGCVLNVTPDHLGLGGVETLRDLARLKSLVVQVVHRRGTSVLNFDDPRTRLMARRAGGRITWFSIRGGADMRPALAQHIAAGGSATVLEPGPRGGAIVVHARHTRERLMDAADIPATIDGQAAFNTANALAAVAIGHAQRVPLATIRLAMSTFQSSFELNPGRLNVADVHGVRAIMDYAHNPAAIKAMATLIRRIRPNYRRALGLVCIPGDRRDEDIREFIGIAAGVFDRLFLREEPGLRGRKRGEMNAFQTAIAVEAGFPSDAIVSRLHEHEAIDALMAEAQPGDLVVLTVTDIARSWDQVNGWTPAQETR